MNLRVIALRFFWPLTLVSCLALVGVARADGTADPQKAPEHKMTQSPSFMMLEPMYATIIDDNKPCGLLMVAVGIDVPDPVLRGEAEHAMPVLRDAFVRSISAFTTTSVRPWEQPDVTLIAERLQRAADRTLGRKGARVLLAQVALHLSDSR
jgi:hypothetical protein